MEECKPQTPLNSKFIKVDWDLEDMEFPYRESVGSFFGSLVQICQIISTLTKWNLNERTRRGRQFLLREYSS